MPPLTEAQFLAKYLRDLVKTAPQNKTTVTVGAKFIRRIRMLGAEVEYPSCRILGDLTLAEAKRYAEQLEKIDAKKGAA